MSKLLRGVWRRLKSRLTPTSIAVGVIVPVLGALASGAGKPAIDRARELGDEYRDAYFCGGRDAMTEGDRLSDLAAKEPTRAPEHFRAANPFYEKAYGCGFPDAGIRLAVAHCMGLGTQKDVRKARQYILEVEGKYEAKRARAKDARQLCGFAH